MDDFPDFSDHGYRVEKELGHNRAGGRVTYLATDIKAQQQVVIKQFQFARLGSNWLYYDAYDREIQLLKELNHPGIPRYLDAFQTLDGFCMVQEYKHAQSLAGIRSFNPDEIRHIAIAALEILACLQNRIPSVIHRDIKPENILVDGQGNVYLVDFGFAHTGEGEVGVSSVVKGTLGFMPPEQIFNRQLTEASDLYGLGMTLICLLTGTKSDQIGNLVDISYRVSFKHLIPRLSVQWINWLEKMVEPRLKDRYANAMVAMAALPSSPLRPPEAQFSHTCLEFVANQLGESLVQSVVIKNPTPETVLEGRWEVPSHPHEPSHEFYRWISVEPVAFLGNHIECHVTIDTQRLMAGKTYSRKLLLHTNTMTKAYPLYLQIQTAAIPTQSSSLPYSLLLPLCLVSLGMTWFVSWIALVLETLTRSPDLAGFASVVGAAIGLEFSAWLMRSSDWRAGSTGSFLGAILVATVAIGQILTGNILTNTGTTTTVEAGVGIIGGAIIGLILGTVIERLVVLGNSKWLAILVSLLFVTFGNSFGLGLTVGFMNSLVLPSLVITGFGLIALAGHLHLRRISTVFSHRRAERYFIKP